MSKDASGARASKPLYGGSKDAYFRRVLRAEPGVGAAASERILRRLSAEVVQVRLRVEQPAAAAAADTVGGAADAISGEPTRGGAVAGESVEASEGAEAAVPPEGAAALDEPGPGDRPLPPFDPYNPNVVVVVRTAGRERALAALGSIDRVENLRLLAREQQLSVAADLATPAELRAAIVAAAERRIANRRAAAG